MKKIARKFVSEPLAEQIAQFIAKASGQTAGANVSAENEQNASEVQDVSENELEQLSKVARQKYETRTESNRYKQQTRGTTPKGPAKIEFAEDKSELLTNPSEPLIQYKKIKEPVPILPEYKKRESKPKYEDLKEDAKEDLDLLLGDEATTKQQKRWKKKENVVERIKLDRQKKASIAKRHRPKQNTDRGLNLNDDALSLESVNRNDNHTDINRLKDFQSLEIPYKTKINDKYNAGMKANDKPPFKQHDRDSKQQVYASKQYERYKSKYRPRNGERHSLKSFVESPTYIPIDIPIDAPVDVPIDEPIEDPLELNFNGAKSLETTKGNKFIEYPPRVNAFNIAVGPAHERKPESRKNFVVATSGNVLLPIISKPEQTLSWQRGGSSPKPQ